MCIPLLAGESIPNRDTVSYASYYEGQGTVGEWKSLLESHSTEGERSPRGKEKGVTSKRGNKKMLSPQVSSCPSPTLPPAHPPNAPPQRGFLGYMLLTEGLERRASLHSRVITWKGDMVPPAGPLPLILNPWGCLCDHRQGLPRWRYLRYLMVLTWAAMARKAADLRFKS